MTFTVGGQNYVAEEGGFARSVELVCNGLLGNDTWKDYAQSLLDAIN
ncbi:MAG: hypothetical protein IJP98_02935 [Clostridia bacterium]|nr:hypothetical protein [Clostridia bacterium]